MEEYPWSKTGPEALNSGSPEKKTGEDDDDDTENAAAKRRSGSSLSRIPLPIELGGKNAESSDNAKKEPPRLDLKTLLGGGEDTPKVTEADDAKKAEIPPASATVAQESTERELTEGVMENEGAIYTSTPEHSPAEVAPRTQAETAPDATPDAACEATADPAPEADPTPDPGTILGPEFGPVLPPEVTAEADPADPADVDPSTTSVPPTPPPRPPYRPPTGPPSGPPTGPPAGSMFNPNRDFGGGSGGDPPDTATHYRTHNPNTSSYTEADISNLEQDAESRGVRRGLVTGLVTGWYVERRHRKRVEAKMGGEIKEQDKQIRGLKQEQFSAQERIKAVQSTQAHIESQLEQEQKRAVREQATNLSLAEQYKRERNQITANTERVVPLTTESVVPRTERAGVMSASGSSSPSGSERLGTASGGRPSIERSPEATRAEIARSEAVRMAKIAGEANPDETPEEYLTTDPNKRVEMSSWHRVEVDARTGQVITDPELAYGEAYQHEVAKEQAPPSRAQAQDAAALGAKALSAAQGQGMGTSSGNAALIGVPDGSLSLAGSAAQRGESGKSSRIDKFKQGMQDPHSPVGQAVQIVKHPVVWVIGFSFVAFIIIVMIFR